PPIPGSSSTSSMPLTLGRPSRPEVWQDLLAEEPDLLVPVCAPELEHHVSAARIAIFLDRCDAIAGRPGDRLALVEQDVRHLRLCGEPTALLHRVRYRLDLVLLDAREVEQRVRRALDVLHLVCEVHAGDLARAVTARAAVARVNRCDDRAADVDLGRHVLTRVADERRRRYRRRQTA